MANYNALKAAIEQVIRANGNNEITGDILQDTLLSLINSLGAGYQFAGIAHTDTNPGTPDQRVFYIAAEAGTYPNFDGLTVDLYESAIFYYNGQWNKDSTGGVTQDALAEYGHDIGVNTLARLTDAGTVVLEQGEMTSTGGNTSSYSYIRFADAIKTPVALAVPDGYKIQAVCYYTNWQDSEHFTFAERVGVNAPFVALNRNYPYCRIAISRTTVVPMNVSEMLDALSLVSSKLYQILPVAFQSGYNYNTDNGYIAPGNGTCVSVKLPYLTGVYTNLLDLGITFNACYYSGETYLGYSTNSITGPTTWNVDDRTLPITHIAFGLYQIPTVDVYYKTPNPEIENCYERSVAKANEIIKEADFSRTVHLNTVYNDDNGNIIALAGYSRTDKFPFIEDGKTNAMDFPAGSCETLYWSNGIYLGYTQNAPYQSTPLTWKTDDHTLPVTHVAFCWNSTDISGVYYIADTDVFPDQSYIDGQVNGLRTYVETQDSQINNRVDGLQTDLGAVNQDVEDLQEDLSGIQQDIQTINESLSELAGQVPPGAIAGNNVWTGTNQFLQPITGVAGTNENNVALLSQLHNAAVAHKWINAKDFGFSTDNTGLQNTAALNNAVQGGGKSVVVTEPGTYKLNGTVLLPDDTQIIFARGVVLQKDAHYQNMFRNAGAEARTYNRNIVLCGVVLDINQKGIANDVDGALFGLRGELSFLCTENVRIFDFRVENLYTGAYAIQFNQSYNFVVENFVIRGQKDGIHISAVDTFVIRNGVLQTTDDALAFNACDWVSSNCVDGDIKNGLVENITDETPSGSVNGYSCRLLAGAWKDYESGMSIHRGDTVVNGGRIYRAYTANPTGTLFTSGTAPTIATFTGKQEDPGGFYWKLMRNDAVYYSANIDNVEFRNIRFCSKRYGFVEEIDTDDDYNRSLYPGLPIADYPKINITIKEYLFANGNYEAFKLSEYSHSNWLLDKMAGQGAGIWVNAPSNYQLLKRLVASNVDFRKYTGSYKVRGGMNTVIYLRDCLDEPAVSVSSSGRVISNCDIANLPGTPKKGDSVIHNQVPKIFNGSNWIALI